jgi:hypothetical protein
MIGNNPLLVAVPPCEIRFSNDGVIFPTSLGLSNAVEIMEVPQRSRNRKQTKLKGTIET